MDKKTLYRGVCGFAVILLLYETSKEGILIWQMDI